MKKKKLIILIIAIISFVIAGSSVFAYFYISSKKANINVTTNLNDNEIVINSFEDLEKYSKNNVHNSPNDFEEASLINRNTLKLQKDVLITHDLLFTSHVNFDLNGNNLYLNGHNITINNLNYGDFMFYSSSTSSSIYVEEVEYDNETYTAVNDGNSGKIILYIPNQTIIKKNILFKNINNTELEFNDYFKVVETTNRVIGYNALYNVAESLLKQYDYRAKYQDLSTLDNNEKITGVDKVIIDSSIYLKEREIDNNSTCHFSNTIHSCSFITSNLDLPFTYGNDKSITIKYESSNEEILDNFGRYYRPHQRVDLNLKAIVFKNEEEIASSTFLIHVLLSDSDMIYGAYTALLSRIEDFYDPLDQRYAFNKEISLPMDPLGTSVTYLPYKESNDNDAIKLFEDENYKYKSLGVSNVKENNETKLAVFTPTNEARALSVTIQKGLESHTFNLKMKSENLIVNSETAIVRDLLNEWYGGIIQLNKTDKLNNVYESFELKSANEITEEENIKYPGITSISYSLVNDTHFLYKISDVANSNLKLLSVNAGKTPEAYIQNVMLSVDARIQKDNILKDVNIEIPIKVISSESDQGSSFLPYYTYYDEYLKTSYNSYISRKFEMPFAYASTGPIILYDFVLIPSNYDSLEEHTLSVNPLETRMIKVSIYYNKQIQHTFTFNENVSYKEEFDLLYDANDINAILSYNDAKWVFEYDIESSIQNNLNLGLVYNYKFSYTASNWTVFIKNDETNDRGQIVSKFELAGVIKYGDDVTNENFYKWIYDNFTNDTDKNNNKLVYNTGDYNSAVSDSASGRYVLTDWLKQDITLDVTNDPILQTINDYTGIKYLVGTTKLNLTGKLLDSQSSIEIAREISNMKNLETLILANCTGLSDGFSNNEPHDNDSISRFINLKKLEYLDVSGCNIYLFDFLNNMGWISEVYVYDQIVDSNNNLNNFYGNRGIANYSVFGSLTDSGINVYNTVQGEGAVLFEKSIVTNDYTRLKSVVHQNKLIEGADIRKLYETYSTNPDDYRLATNYTYLSGSTVMNVDVNSRTLTWSYLEYTLTKDEIVDNNKTYYIKQGSSYVLVDNPINDDIGYYYEYVSPFEATEYMVTYHFSFTNSDVEINLIVKFKIERYKR